MSSEKRIAIYFQIDKLKDLPLGSGCGSVGREVTSNSRGLRFESSNRQKFILNIYCQLSWKDKNKEKEAGKGPFLKIERFAILNDRDYW